MKYMGSKRRIAKHILPIILEGREEGQWYVEPFCGGCNTLDKVDGNRVGNDIHKELIAFLTALRDGWLPPYNISEDEYNTIKDNREKFPQELVGYVGFALSFGSKWFGGFSRDGKGKRNYAHESYRNAKKQQPLLEGIVFKSKSYLELEIPENSIIYCDPPYFGATSYKDKFNHELFWEWCVGLVKQGHKVFVSEYSAPDGWKAVWEKPQTTTIDMNTTKTSVEKLFVYKGE